MTFTVTRSGNITAAKSLTFNAAGTTNGDTVVAATTADATPTSGVVNFAAGAATATFTISANSDTQIEGLEGLKVSLFDGTTVAASKTILINDDPNAPVPGQSYSLTTSADSGSGFTGTAGADTFVGAITSDRAAASTTYGPGDSIVGGLGTDTLRVAISGTHTGPQTHTSFAATGVEVVSIDNYETSANLDTFDASLWSGVTTVGLTSSSATGDVTVQNLGSIVEATMSNGSGDLTFDYTDSILTGSSDTQVLNVSGLGTTGGTFAVDATIESLTIKSTGSASTLAAVTATGATKISVNATAALTITGALSTAALTVDASSSTAGVSLAATGAADYTITGGSGNDTVDIGNELTTADSLIGGAGVDTLVVTDSSDIVADLKVSGFETVRLSEAGQTADLQYLSGITTIAYRAGAANSTTAINVAEGTAVLIDDDATTLTHTVKDASNAGVTNSVTVTIDNDTDETDIDIGTAFVAAGVETLSFVSRGITSPAAAAAGSENSIASLVGSTGLVTVNASGASDFEITSTGAIATLTAVNAAGMTGRFTVTNASTATARTTITGGSGADTITGRSSLDSILGGAGNDTIDGADGNDYVDGGAGVDSITGGTGNDTILGGDGNDTIDSETGVDNVSGGAGDDVFLISATYTTNLTSSDTISGGDGTDTLRFTTAGDTAIQLVTNSGILTNVSGIDRIGLGAAAAQTLTINDLALSVSDGSSITVIADTNQAHAVVASGVLNSAATVGFIMGSAVTNATTLSYTVGNAKDRVIFGVADGAITATNMAFLSATDTITGGSTIGDVLSITDDNALTISTATAGHRLAGVTSVETISIDTTDGTATADYVITLDNTFVAANYDSTNAKFTISRGAADTGDTDVLGGAVTGYNLDVTGGAAADTITGGSGNDTLEGGDGIDTVSGGAGNDRIIGTDATDATDADNLTGGQGNDTFVYDVTPTGVDVITDFQLPSDNGATLASVLDTFELDGLTLAFDGAGFNTVLAIAAGATLAGDNDIAATDDVIILGNATYATLTAMATDLAAGAAAGTEDAIVFWADTFGTVHLAYTTDRNTAASAVDVATLSGISITGVATVVTTANIGMFDVA